MQTKLLYILVLVGTFQSCIVNSTLTDIPLIEEKGQKVISTGIAGPIPACNVTYAYGLTDKYAIQTAVHISLLSAHVQQSFGIYKRLNDRVKTELYGGYLYGFGSYFNFGGESSMYGTYQLLFGQYNYGRTFKKFPNLTTGFSIKPGFLYLNYTIGHDVPDTSNHEYPFKWVVEKNKKAYGIYAAPLIFIKSSRPRMNLGFYAQFQGVWSVNSNRFGILPFTLGISYQYKKGSKEEIKEYKEKRESRYLHHQNVSLSYRHQPYTPQYVGIVSNINQTYEVLPIILSYQFQLNYWFSMGISAYYHTAKGNAKVIERIYLENTNTFTEDNYNIDYNYKYFNLSINGALHYYLSNKLDIYSTFYWNKNKPHVEIGRYKIINSEKHLYESRTFNGYSYQFTFAPIGIKYFFNNSVGGSFEYGFYQPHASTLLANFTCGVHYKF